MTALDWDNGMAELKYFREEHGHSQIPANHITASGFNLGSFVIRNLLTQERIARLDTHYGNALNTQAIKATKTVQSPPIANLYEKGSREWDRNFSQLQRYTIKYGSCIPYEYIIDSGKNLSAWISNQLRKYKSKTLSENHIDQLESLIDWSWDRLGTHWNDCFAELVRYEGMYDTTLVPARYISDSGINLGAWANTQRVNYKNNTINNDRINQLESMSDWTWGRPSLNWNECFDELERYSNQYGTTHCPRHHSTHSGIQLGQWVRTQRSDYINNKINQFRIDRLESLIDWVWSRSTNKWDDNFKLLQSFVKEHGHARVPSKYITSSSINLGAWVSRQKLNVKNNTLSQDCANQLDSLNGWTLSRYTDKWDDNFKLLQSFVKEHGHARVPSAYIASDSIKLGAWVSRQKTSKINNTLSQDRIALLEYLPGWVWTNTKSYY